VAWERPSELGGEAIAPIAWCDQLMNQAHKIFFAIPFDTATSAMYGRIAAGLRERFPSVTTVIGTEQVGPSPKYSTLASFRAQNRKLEELFVDQIRAADVVIADLTHNNPNVHLELGVALQLNKNVLRVTGRQLIELGFDIRNLDVYAYKEEKDLLRRIIKYLSTFSRIKRLSINPQHVGLYHRLPDTPRELVALGMNAFTKRRLSPRDVFLRDGAVRVTFEIAKVITQQDWFGVMFRSGDNPLLGSHMVYIRKSGAVELALYPGPQVIAGFQTAPIQRRRTALIEFENEEVSIKVGGSMGTIRPLSNQTVGSVWLAAWQAEVVVHSAEMVTRDTIEWPRRLGS